MTDLCFVENQLRFLEKFCELHNRVKGLCESLYEIQPIAVVKDNNFFLFVQRNGKYEFMTEHPTPFPIDFEILAAFPLEFYSNKTAAIITENTLKNPSEHIWILHEFVHCFQGDTCEQQLKNSLKIAKQQIAAGNFQWEINYPFPYGDDFFIRLTEELESGGNFTGYHDKLRGYLAETDFEYLIWQEWKEGFARYIENLVRRELELELNSGELSKPFSRVSFYEIGSRYISALIDKDASLMRDLHKLFNAMA